ncbi:FkbM family methyltransferase [Pontibacter locisalis]|uniref:FkbM family methyltransferase n=1 Tax=Pontibacter locisalis TaxID=1719035 RepID=A0ABW5IPP8_9BACT
MKVFLKRVLPRDSVLYSLCRFVYNYKPQIYVTAVASIKAYNTTLLLALENRWLPKPWKFDAVNAYAKYRGKVEFIQIGSNNGITGDPISDYIKNNNWTGVLIEPVPYLFEELKNNYSNFQDRLLFENSAIANKNGKLKFYRLKKSDLPGLPEYYDQLGSFNKEVVLTHRNCIPYFFDLFFEDYVNAITFKDLLEKYNIDRLDFVHIDTEGYDYEILKMLPFSDLNIEFIMFEHKHLNGSDYKQAVKLLKQNRFKIGTNGGADTIAIKKSIYNHIT